MRRSRGPSNGVKTFQEARNREIHAPDRSIDGPLDAFGGGSSRKALFQRPRLAKAFPVQHSLSVSDTKPGPGLETPRPRAQTLKLLSLPGDESVVGYSSFANPGVVAEVAGLTDRGQVRESNQDQFLMAGLERALYVEGSSLPTHRGTRLTDRPQGRIFIVADGIGGSGGGEVASAVATDAMALYAFAAMPWMLSSNENPNIPALADGLREALRHAQDRMRRVAQRKGINPTLGTTLTMAYVAWPSLYLVHVGDSRAYLLRDGQLHRLTRDHTLAQQLVDGKAMTEEEARHSRFSHVLVNAVGGESDELEVELHHHALRAGDQLMLCSDGLYDMVDDSVIATHLGRGSETAVEEVVAGMVEAANAAGGRDNVTVVLARF